MAIKSSFVDVAERGIVNVFLLAGQSNMAGADAVIVDPPGFQPTAADRATRFTAAPLPAGNQSPLYLPWGELRGQPLKNELVHGPEIGFARVLHGAGWRNVCIIKVYANFSRDVVAWPWSNGGLFFDPWMRFIDGRIAEVQSQVWLVRFCGVLWHQGIDDAIHGSLAYQYSANLRDLIVELRQRWATSTMPFVLARSVNSSIARAITGAGENSPMAAVRRAQVNVGRSVPYAAWIDVDDFPNVNSHHFCVASQLSIGVRFGLTFLKLHGDYDH